MNFQTVGIAASGPQTFLCCACDARVNQAHGPVWADLDGPAFKAYYCRPCRDAALDAKQIADITMSNHGSLFLCRARTPAGQEWLDEHVAFEHFFGGAGVIEPRYVEDVVCGAVLDGLLVAASP